MSFFQTNAITEFFPTSREAHASSRDAAIEAEVLALFDLLRIRLFRYVVSFSLSTQDSEDIVQEVFLALFSHLQANGSRSNLQAWLYRVAHNLALKRRMMNRRLESGFNVDERCLELAADPHPNAEQQFAFQARQAGLMAIMHALPDQDERCLRLRAEGLKYREIAAVLGISLGGVSLSLTRSLERLRRGDWG